MKCQQSASWTFQPEEGKRRVRVQMAIGIKTPIQGEDLVSVSILAPWERFPDEMNWEVMDKLRTGIVNGFHVGLSLVKQPLPPGGIDIEETALQIKPQPLNMDTAEVQGLTDALYWAAAGMVVSCWQALHALSAKTDQE